jgi:KaiC/GvpD/RAD55 family RecA-like ATPase
MNNYSISNQKVQAPISQGLQVLVKQLFSLYRQWDYNDVTFTENAIAIGELFINLGFDPIEVKLWLSGHKLLLELDTPVVSSDFQDLVPGKGWVTLWDEMIDELQDGLLRLGMKIDDQTAINWLEQIEQFCKDETELLKIGQRVKKMLINHSGWQNLITPFQRKLSRRIWDEREKGKQPPIDDSAERLKLEIQAFLKESDPFVKIQQQGKICSTYRISRKDFELLCKITEAKNSTPQSYVYGLTDFLQQATDAIDWIVPGMLPKGEMALLAAQAKCGKTLLACDIAYAVLTGTKAVGETVKQGKVLLVSSDESQSSTRRRLYARGFDLISNPDQFRILTYLDLNDLNTLEAQLEDFRPDLVVIDSLTSCTLNSSLSEKDAEFAKSIYKLKDLIGRYGASSILIHHENKSKEAKGIEKVSGSARITAAVWGIWRLTAANPDDDSETTRWLSIKPREGESVTHILDLNAKDQWLQNGIFSHIGEFGDESGEKKAQSQKILELLTGYQGRGLTANEICNALPDIPKKSLYRACDRLEDRQMITKRRSSTDGKTWVYAIPTDDYQTPIAVSNKPEQTIEPVIEPETTNELTEQTPKSKPDIKIGQTISYLSSFHGPCRLTVASIENNSIRGDRGEIISFDDLIIEKS